MRQCERCGRLVEPELLLCPDCRQPLIRLEPFVSRPMGRTLIGMLVIVVGLLVWLIARRLIA